MLIFGLFLLRTACAGTVPESDSRQALQASWLKDASGQLTIEDVVQHTAEFEPFQDSLSQGHTRDVYWLKVILPAHLAGRGDHWLNLPPPLLDDVRLYTARSDGGWHERRGGGSQPFSAREGSYRGTAFLLDRSMLEPTAETLTVASRETVASALSENIIYLRVASSGPLVVTPELWSTAALQSIADRETLIAGIFFGVMAATALINLIGWLITRHDVYGLFALFVICSALRWAGFDGLIGQYLSPDDAILPRLIDNVLLGAQNVTGSLCQIRLLQLHSHFPRLLRYYQLAGVLPGILLMLTPWTGHFSELSSFMFLCLLPAPLVSIPAYLRLWREGEWSGRLVAVILPLHFLIMWPAILGNLGWLPFSPVFAYAARLAALPVILTLHVGIALQTREAERARDQAQRRAAEAQAVSERERRAREERERFLSMIAHEVRTPVAVIEAAAHSLRLIDERHGDPAMRAGRYENIRNAVARMRTLMELTEAEERLQAGSPAAQPGSVDLAKISREVLAAFEPAIAARVSMRIAAHLPSLLGDARLLYFALVNLVDNAVKYATPGTPIEIDIACASDPAGQRGVEWRIRDHGPGIPADKEDMIFDKYLRLDESAALPGLGLGLPLVRDIATKHAGQLRLGRDWQHGACFILWLPAQA